MSYLTRFASANYGGMRITTDTAQSIAAANDAHAIYGGATGSVLNFTFTAGCTQLITAFADAGGGKTTVTCGAGHTLANGDYCTISNTTNYDGAYLVSDVAGNNFAITKAFNGDDAQGTARRGDRLVAGYGADGVYSLGYSVSASEAGAAGSTASYTAYVNATAQTQAECKRKYANNDVGNSGAVGLVTIAEGDHVWFGLTSTGTNTITIAEANATIHRIET